MNTALIAFALAGGMMAFMYFNLNPARIFMGDTGSLVLGFVIAVLCIRLIEVNQFVSNPVLPHAPVFVLGIVLIPVFDTVRVFATRIWMGKSPFSPDKTHIHHLLTWFYTDGSLLVTFFQAGNCVGNFNCFYVCCNSYSEKCRNDFQKYQQHTYFAN